jgi:hypothetical protein
LGWHPRLVIAAWLTVHVHVHVHSQQELELCIDVVEEVFNQRRNKRDYNNTITVNPNTHTCVGGVHMYIAVRDHAQ